MIQEEELYNDGELRLVEYRVMLEGECIAKSWREFHDGEIKSAAGIDRGGDISHYTLPKWYVRQQKLDEIL